MHKDKELAKEYRHQYRRRINVVEKRKVYERKRYRNKPYDKQQQLERHLKYLYKLTLNEYQLLLNSQNGKCKICGDLPTSKRLHVDHSHSSGKVRGLLCNNCNLALGLLKENTNILDKMIKYLNEFSGF